MKKTGGFILFLIQTISSQAQVDSTYQGKLSDFILQEYSEFYVKYLSTVNLEKNDFLLHYFVYKNKEGESSGGSGFKIVKSNQETPFWYKSIDGDFGPHTVSTLKINKDKKLDIFFYTGFEDVFSTYIYLGNYDSITSYSEKNFVQIYSNRNSYSVLFDLDGDNYPEILDSGYKGNKHKNGFSCLENPYDITIKQKDRLVFSDSVKQAITDKYFDLTGPFDQYNFDYSMPKAYPLINTFILSPIKIFKVEGSNLLNVTSAYSGYLTWRIKILKQIKEDSSKKCGKRIDNIITYLNNQVAK